MKTTATYKPGIVTVLFILFTGISLFPVLALSVYNLPLSDEFAAMRHRNTFTFLEYQEYLFSSWSGRYIANFLEIIYPLKLQYLFYQLAPVVVGGIIYLSLFLLFKRIAGSRQVYLTTGAFLIILNYIPSAADLLFYVPAIIIYTVSFIIIFLFLFVLLLDIDEKIKITAFILTNILLLGTVELYIPVVLFFSALLFFYSILRNRNKLLSFLNLTIILTITYILLSASGNLNRYSMQKNEIDILFSTLHYLRSLFYWSGQFLIALPFVLLLALTIKQEDIRMLAQKINYWHILILILGYFLLYSPLFFINLYKYDRLGNVFFIYFLFLTLTLSIKTLSKFNFFIKKGRLLLFLSAVVLFLFSGNIRTAYRDVHHGFTKDLSSNLKARYKILEKNRNTDLLILDKIPEKDYLLSIQDVNDTEDTSLVIDMYKMYYNIDSLVIK